MREPAVGEARHTFHRDLFIRTHPERDRPLHRERVDARSIDAMPAAFVVDELPRAEQAQHLDLLLDALGTIAPTHAERLVLDVVPSDRNAKTNATAREEVEGRGLLRYADGMALREDEDHGRAVQLH